MNYKSTLYSDRAIVHRYGYIYHKLKNIDLVIKIINTAEIYSLKMFPVDSLIATWFILDKKHDYMTVKPNIHFLNHLYDKLPYCRSNIFGYIAHNKEALHELIYTKNNLFTIYIASQLGNKYDE